MAQKIGEIMTQRTITMSTSTAVTDAAKAMREADVGDVMVLDDSEKLRGILTDRDIVVRVLAEDRDPSSTTTGDVCSSDVVTAGPEDAVEEVVEKIRNSKVRRIPVVENGRPVGIVSMGDLAIERDARSALADVSAAEPNT